MNNSKPDLSKIPLEVLDYIKYLENMCYHQHIPTKDFEPYIPTELKECKKCGIDVQGLLGYVCPNDGCPIQFKVVC